MKKIVSKFFMLILCLIIGLSMTACSSSNQESTTKQDGKVSIFMPSEDLQRWNQDGKYLKEELEDDGYTVDLQYAQNDASTQISQIKKAIDDGCDALIIAAVDRDSLSDILSEAKEKNIKVVAYDRLIMNTDVVSCYVTFDNYKVGQIQGDYIVDTLGLDEGKGPYNLEILSGPLEDNNSYYFFAGAMDKLQLYIDNEQLIIKSKNKTIEDTAISGWSTEKAQDRMDEILSSTYKDKKIDAVLCANDSIANGVTKSLKENGFNKDNFPIVTGQDCDIQSVKNIIDGTQSMSVFKDTRVLSQQVSKMLGQLINDQKIDSNDDKSYDNGVEVVPTYLCKPGFVDKQNYKQAIIDTGYYEESELN